MERNYAAFISYRHAPKDMAAAKMLHSLIEQFPIPRALRKEGGSRFGPVFRDQEELSASGDLSAEICAALDRSRYLIVVCSKSTALSPWVEREIEYFLRGHDRAAVFTLLIEGEPAEVFPRLLTHAPLPEGGEKLLEPLAVDVRAGSIPAMRRALRREAPRLYAAMLGCAYDELVQRTQRRRRRRSAALMSAALAVALSFSALLLVKNHQIDLKNRELEDKNETLLLQRDEILLRESELLSRNAREALAEGDYAEAMDFAAAALPSHEGERPYLAEAEAALIEALDIWGLRSERHIIVSAETEQLSSIEHFALLPDGSGVLTLDGYGCLRFFRSSDGEKLWESSLPPSYAAPGYTDEYPLLLSADGSCAAVFYGGSLAAFSAEEGSMLWKHDFLQPEPGSLCLASGADLIALLAEELDMESGRRSHSLLLLDLRGGETLASIPVPVPGGDSSLLSSAAAALSPRGDKAALSFLLPDEEGSYSIHYRVADTRSGEIISQFSEPLPPQRIGLRPLLSFSPDGESLFALHSVPGGLILEGFAAEGGGKLLSSGPLAGEGEGGLILTASRAYVRQGSVLRCIDGKEGSLLWETDFGSPIVSLEIVWDSFFAYVLADGSQGLAWKNEGGFHRSAVYGAEAKLGELSSAALGGGGLVCAEVAEGSIRSMSVGGGGIAAVLDREGRLSIKRSRPLPGAGSSGVPCSGAVPAARVGGDCLLLGPIREGESCRVDICSAADLSLMGSIPVENTLRPGDIHPLPEGGGFIWDDGFGGISLLGPESRRVLSERESVSFGGSGAVGFMDSPCLSATVATAEGGLLSLRVSEEGLSLWENGRERSIALPEGLIWQLPGPVSFHRIFAAGGSGLALLSLYEDDGDLLSDGFALCDLSTGEWEMLPDSGSGESGRRAIVGGSKAIFALMEQDGSLWVYEDRGEGFLPRRLETGLPLSSVEQLEFLPGDGEIMVKSSDAQLMLFDARDGEMLLNLPLSGSGELSLWADETRSRLYISQEYSAAGLCIDLRSHSLLAEVPGLLCFDSQGGNIFRLEGGCLSACSLPSTEELRAMALELLG